MAGGRHQQVVAEVMYVRSPYAAARWLAEVCGRLGAHLQAVDTSVEAVVMQLREWT